MKTTQQIAIALTLSVASLGAFAGSGNDAEVSRANTRAVATAPEAVKQAQAAPAPQMAQLKPGQLGYAHGAI
jgi:hypothetical protein